jgi:hypothetical protein
MKSWKNKVWAVTVEEVEGGQKLTIRKNRMKQHQEVIPAGGDENCPLSIPNYVMERVLDLLIEKAVK